MCRQARAATYAPRLRCRSARASGNAVPNRPLDKVALTPELEAQRREQKDRWRRRKRRKRRTRRLKTASRDR